MFEIGDVVYLKSSPQVLMTVSKLTGAEGPVFCIYYDGFGEYQERKFPQSVLAKKTK